jgi:hypothetical protein
MPGELIDLVRLREREVAAAAARWHRWADAWSNRGRGLTPVALLTRLGALRVPIQPTAPAGCAA